MSQSYNVIIMGIPDAGKSNFIIRFWLALQNKIGRLQGDGLPDDLDYLMTGAENQLGGRFAGHTPDGFSSHSRIPFKAETDNGIVNGMLVVPDYHGEEWLRIYRNRQWSETWEQLIATTCGCLVFIRADSEEIIDPLDWISAGRYFGFTIAQKAKDEDGGGTPTQVILVEWLQFLRRAFTDLVNGDFKPRIGIIISAWDFVPDDQKDLGPERYVELNFPMLKQFVDSNTHSFTFKFFGVSIVGGDLKDDAEFREEYRRDPTHAGYVVHHSNGTVRTTKDVTFPVWWAMGIKAFVQDVEEND